MLFLPGQIGQADYAANWRIWYRSLSGDWMPRSFVYIWLLAVRRSRQLRKQVVFGIMTGLKNESGFI